MPSNVATRCCCPSQRVQSRDSSGVVVGVVVGDVVVSMLATVPHGPRPPAQPDHTQTGNLRRVGAGVQDRWGQRHILARMDLLRLEPDFDAGGATALVVALDGWTDAGSGATTAADALRDLTAGMKVGEVDPDQVFDFRDRRPLVPIEQGKFGAITWPEIGLYRLDPTDAPPFLLLTGAEPDFGWRGLSKDLVELTHAVGLTDYVGLGSVPGPVPHTRPVRITSTSNNDELLAQYGHTPEQMIVPASAQVTLEVALGEVGLRTLGMWARVPHYVAGDYPAAAAMLLRTLGGHLGFTAETTELETEAVAHRERLDEAAENSDDVSTHITALEGAYDADAADDAGMPGPLPTGDQIAEELEQFLRKRDT